MRCSCPNCGAFMVQQESGDYLGCRCPECLYGCNACMGTDSVLSKDEIARFRVSGEGRLAALKDVAEQEFLQTEDTQRPEEENEQLWMSD